MIHDLVLVRVGQKPDRTGAHIIQEQGIIRADIKTVIGIFKKAGHL